MRGSVIGSLLLSALLSSGCGEYNLNGLIFGGGGDDAADSMMVEAQIAYDQGRFDEAEKIVTELLKRNERNEAAAVLLGYVNLSRGGIDPFRLARELIKLSENKATDAAQQQQQQQPQRLQQQDQPAPSSGSSNNNASDTLRELASIISLSEADFLAMQKEPFTGTSGLFATTPIIVPVEVDDTLRAKISVLRHMNAAIKAVCRFVSDDVRVEGEERHESADCAPLPGAPRKNQARAHFLWAFSHLTEALVYQSVLLYANAGSSTSNFELASKALDSGTFVGEDGFSQFVNQVSDMKTAVDLVFDTSSPKSMISSTLRDMDAVNRAFGLLTGLPKKITQRISNAMLKITDVGQKVGANGEQIGSVGALKGQMTEKMTKTVGGKIDKVTNDLKAKYGTDDLKPETIDALPGFTPQQKDKMKSNVEGMCTAYDNLSKGLAAETVAASQPAECK